MQHVIYVKGVNMSQVIRIPSKIYKRLGQHANGFDTPANVIERLLNHYEGVDDAVTTNEEETVTSKKNISKYSFEGHIYGKGRLVLAVIQSYVAKNPDTSLKDLQDLFPKNLQGSSGVFSSLKDAREIYKRTGHKRHFIKSNEVIELSDAEIAVSTEWGKDNIDNFIEVAENLGHDISVEE